MQGWTFWKDFGKVMENNLWAVASCKFWVTWLKRCILQCKLKMHLMSHVLDFILFIFLKRCLSQQFSHRMSLAQIPGQTWKSLAELCGHCSQPPLVAVPHLLNQVLGGQGRAGTPTHALVNVHSLKDDIYSLPGQTQDLYCWGWQLGFSLFAGCLVCWRGKKGEKELLCSRSWLPAACQANKEITSACPKYLKHCIVQICGCHKANTRL